MANTSRVTRLPNDSSPRGHGQVHDVVVSNPVGLATVPHPSRSDGAVEEGVRAGGADRVGSGGEVDGDGLSVRPGAGRPGHSLTWGFVQVVDGHRPATGRRTRPRCRLSRRG